MEKGKIKAYIGVKQVHASPMTLGEYCQYRRKPMNEGEDASRPGYWLCYAPDGYESWSPKDVFENAYFPLEKEHKLEQADIDRFINQSPLIESSDIHPKTTLVHVQMPTGWDEYETSSCVDPKNYNHEMGKQCALSNIKGRLWKHLGFVLQWARHGLTYKEQEVFK